jgi:hypothetical protein
MSDIKTARAELVALLTPIAPVRTGQAALETTSAALPVWTLWSTGDQLAEDQGFAVPHYRRRLTAEYKMAATATYDDDLDDVLHTMRRALCPSVGEPVLPHATALQEIAVRFYAPDLTVQGGTIAILQVDFELGYLERLNVGV